MSVKHDFITIALNSENHIEPFSEIMDNCLSESETDSETDFQITSRKVLFW